MTLRFARWELQEDGFPPRSVLRVVLGGALLSDPLHADVFASPLAAAEAAWRVAGEPEGDAGWLDRAHAALEADSEGTLRSSGHPRPRVLGSRQMADGEVGWLAGAPLVGTDEWAMASAAGAGGVARHVQPPPAGLDTPLSGLETAEWSLLPHAAEAAGQPRAGSTRRQPAPNLAVQKGEQLSGKSTGDWHFAKVLVDPSDEDDAP